MKTATKVTWAWRIFSLLVAILLVVSCAPTPPYMKMDPPPDVDKGPPPPPGDNSCWLATASNMLAGAGYGTGDTVQARADEIYGEMVAQYGTANTGWTDTALTWWLSSNLNTWPNNPYTVVTVYGNKSPRYPWANSNGARFFGNELRRCLPVGLSISWPTDEVGAIGSGGHAITAWGDPNGNTSTLTTNPSGVRLVDSDNETGGDVQAYTYDTYTNPNPGGPNEGNGWYFDYDNNHPYIKHIVTLSPTDDPSDDKLTQKVVGSYKIHQTQELSATDLHYDVGTDVTILSYKTTVSWSTENPPTITESGPARTEITVDWDFSDNPVPYCEWVTVTTEFVLPTWNAIEYDNVHFTYPDTVEAVPIPSLYWQIETPIVENAVSISNVTGGYVVGSFEIVDPNLPGDQQTVAEYLFIHEYSFNQSPEYHTFALRGENQGYYATNFRFGHSYGYLDTESLWEFDEWMTEIPEKYSLEDEVIELSLDWEGRLPYPEGEDITGRIPDIPSTAPNLVLWIVIVLVVVVGTFVVRLVLFQKRRE